MHCTAQGLNRIRLSCESLVIFGVPYKLEFNAVFVNGAWVPDREQNHQHYSASWTGDALFLYRLGGQHKDPSQAAHKRATEMCINEANAWALSNKNALLQAEVALLQENASKTGVQIADMEHRLQGLKLLSIEQWAAVRYFKKEHGLQ